MAQFPFQNAILKIESKKKERAPAARFSFCLHMAPCRKQGLDPQVNLFTLRRQITDLVAQNAVAMVQQAIDAVNEEGQYQAIKYLFEMIGLYPASVEDESPVGDSLARTLLDRLGLSEAMPAEPEQREKEFTASNPLK